MEMILKSDDKSFVDKISSFTRTLDADKKNMTLVLLQGINIGFTMAKNECGDNRSSISKSE